MNTSSYLKINVLVYMGIFIERIPSVTGYQFYRYTKKTREYIIE